RQNDDEEHQHHRLRGGRREIQAGKPFAIDLINQRRGGLYRPAVAAVLWIFLFNPGRGLITHFLGEFGYDWNHAQNSGQAMFL
ncbi:hypothetical protein MJH54_34970, partial [Salmonella enterica subsp. enterica serovar Montevideo]|nr:hypothetical protein [Salmonella enterica subsp. enterica serovar Montevideo]